MHVRSGVAVVVASLAGAAAMLSGCSGDDAKDTRPSAPLTEITVECDKFADTAQRITDAQTELYTGTGGKAAIDQLVGELEQLEEGAPADVQTALENLADGFRDAQELLADPSAENKEKLTEVSQSLAKDGQRITAYIVSKCD